MPSAVLDAAHGSARTERREPIIQEFSPIVRSHLVKRVYHVIKSVGHNLWRTTLPTVEQTAKVIERLCSIGLLADSHVGIQPYERAFVVIIDAASPAVPLLRRVIEKLSGNRCIQQW